MARTGGELLGMADGRSDRGGAWWGHAAGVGRAGVPGTGARGAGSATGQWGGRRREAGPGPRRGGMRRTDAPAWGTREAWGNPPPLGASRRPTTPSRRSARLPGRRGCGERRAHTRAHTPGEHAQCGPGNFLPSREPPRPPPGPLWAPLRVHGVLSWGRPSAWVGGGRGARLSPFRAAGFCSDLSAARADRPHGWERGCGCHPPLPKARSEAGRPEAWRCGRLSGGLALYALAERTDPAPGADWVEGGV